MFPYLFAIALTCLSYTVKPGDTLSKIAKANHSIVSEITKTNYLVNQNLISVGQVLCIPVKSNPTPQYKINILGQDQVLVGIARYQLDQAFARCPEIISHLSEIRIESIGNVISGAETAAWVDVITGVARVDAKYVNYSSWFQQQLIHEASHVKLYHEGRVYAGVEGETSASILASTCYPNW